MLFEAGAPAIEEVGEVGPGSYLFQVYRTRDGVCAWRLVSPNGRVIGCSTVSFATPADARRAIPNSADECDRMEPVLRTTHDHRWLWMLHLDGDAVARGATTQDRHVRCVMAWQRFVLAAPLGVVSAEVLHFPCTGPGPGRSRPLVAPL